MTPAERDAEVASIFALGLALVPDPVPFAR
jgi:hypothetical protein